LGAIPHPTSALPSSTASAIAGWKLLRAALVGASEAIAHAGLTVEIRTFATAETQ